MSHILDKPIWSALETRHAHLAVGGPLAWRYRPEVAAFAASRDESDASVAALATLPEPGQEIRLLQASVPTTPAGVSVIASVAAVQMVLVRPPAPVPDARIEQFRPEDAAEMLDLATLTKPGPFTLHALDFGDFFGIRVDGRIIAMAGERFKQPGYTEVSGICTHPDFRSRGLGRLMTVFMVHHVLGRGETPYLHSYANNEPALALYRSLGFELRTPMTVTVFRREQSAAA